MKLAKWILAGISAAILPLSAEEKPGDKLPPQYGETIDLETPGSALVLDGNTLYMTFCGKRRIVAAVDTADPAKPKLLAEYKTGYFPQGLALDKAGNRLYSVDGRYLTVLGTANSKLTMQMRFLINESPFYGPVDVAYTNGRLVTACRNAGWQTGTKNMTDTVFENNCWTRGIYQTFDGGYMPVHAGMIPFGTARKIRKLDNNRYILANGFSGIAVLDRNGKLLSATRDLNRFSCYGAHVYDAAVAADGKTVYMAAGEIGVVKAVTGTDNAITLESDVPELRWGNVNGILLSADGKYLYVSDESFGLRVLETATLKQAGKLDLTKEK